MRRPPFFDPFSENRRFSLSTMRPGFCLGSPKRAQKGRKKHTPKTGLCPGNPPDLAPARKDPFWPLFDPFSETCRVSLGTMRPGFCLWSPKRAQKRRKNKTPFLSFLRLPDPQNDHFRSFLTLFQNPTFKSTPGLFHDFAKGGQNLCPQNSQNRCLWRILRVCVQGYHKHIR